jgi:hypothetical protein
MIPARKSNLADAVCIRQGKEGEKALQARALKFWIAEFIDVR